VFDDFVAHGRDETEMDGWKLLWIGEGVVCRQGVIEMGDGMRGAKGTRGWLDGR
jgi:hypothetical protein